ncbi:unnamed protein product [Merluccius merluccius]
MELQNISGSAGGVPLAVDFDSPLDYLVFIFQLLLGTTAVLLSGTVAIGILATKTLRIQNRFIFMLNTSICDTLVGFSVYYLGLFDVYEGYPPRNGTYNVLPSFLGVNILTFLFAQFDRYFAVCHPFIYGRFVTTHFVVGVNVYVWVYNFAHILARNLIPASKAADLFVFSVLFLQGVILAKVAMTIKLYVVAKYQLEREPPSAERDGKAESLRIIIFVVVSFLALWAPSFVNIVLRFVFGMGLRFANEALNPFATLARLSAVCTSAVYVWGSPALRGAMRRTVWGRVCPRCKRRVGSSQEKGEALGMATRRWVNLQRFKLTNKA